MSQSKTYSDLMPGDLFARPYNPGTLFLKVNERRAIGMGGTLDVQVYLYVTEPFPSMDVVQDSYTQQCADEQLEVLRQGHISKLSAEGLAQEALDVLTAAGEAKTQETRTCSTCRFYTPTDYSIGTCRAQGQPSVTHATNSCVWHMMAESK
jgi:hypothetical protein